MKSGNRSVAGAAFVGGIESLGSTAKMIFPHEAGRARATAVENETVRLGNVYNTFREGGHSFPVAAAGTAGMAINDLGPTTNIYHAGSGLHTDRLMATGDFTPTLKGPERLQEGLSAFNKTAGAALWFASLAKPIILNPGAMDAAWEAQFKEIPANAESVLYQKVGSNGEHLKYGIAKNEFKKSGALTRYTEKELGGGRTRLLAAGSKQDMLTLERYLHENMPLGPEEGQDFYKQLQATSGYLQNGPAPRE
jgi:hypothetical protein